MTDDPLQFFSRCPTKRCTKCGEEKPVNKFYAKKKGLSAWCNTCVCAYRSLYRLKHYEQVRETERKSQRKNLAKSKERWKKYSAANRERLNAHNKQYRAENPEKVASSIQKYRKNNADKIRESVRKWAKNNPDKMRLHWAETGKRKRALVSGATVEKFSFLEIFERDLWVCQICHRKVNRKLKHPHPLSPSLDHIVPLSKGGEHSRLNTQLAHLSCNVDLKAGGIKQLRLIS